MNKGTDSRGSLATRTTFWGKKFLIIVTGASGGVGRGVAVNFAKHVAEGSLLVITGRNTAGLEETKRMIAALGRDVSVSIETCDHSRASFAVYQDLLRRASAQVVNPDRIVLVHNAATIGSSSDYVVSYDNEKKIGDYYHLNLTSIMTLTAAFLQHFNSDLGPTRLIVNISSVAAIVPIQGLGLYCTGKAAREMYMRVVAQENPSVTVCSYNPGAVDTAMLGQMGMGTEDCATRYQNVFKNGHVLTPEATADRLVRILEHQNFKPGECVNHYDAPDERPTMDRC